MVFCRFLLVLLVVISCLCSADTLELTEKNWDKQSANKTVFIKFFAPWCGHCKKIKPDWDKLMADFKGSPAALVAEVDCAGKGKPLCETHGITGFPRLMWGKADEKLEVYNGARNYQEMKVFSDDYLGPSCGPGSLDLCDENRSVLMKRFMAIPPEKLHVKVQAAHRQMKQAEEVFMNQQFNFTLAIDMAEKSKNEEVKAIKDRQGLTTGTAVKGAFELSTENWDEKVNGKAVFIKFYAPWCGHCQKMKPDWDKLMAHWEGTKSSMVAEVDCTKSGKELCEKFSVTGYPRLMWAKAGDTLTVYSESRTYADMYMFADMVLGNPCGPSNIELCEKDFEAIHQQAANMSPEKREAKERAAEKEIAEAERRYQDVEWNMSLAIDKAEQDRDKRIKEIKSQGLGEALKVAQWNKAQPEGFWKPPILPPSESRNFLLETAFEVQGFPVNFLMVGATTGALIYYLMLLARNLGSSSRSQTPSGPSCKARHILTETEEEILKAKARLDSGEEFGKVAAEFSRCPSGKSSGGSLGLRVKGTMDPAVDKVCFDASSTLGQVLGPVKTKFGYHLMVVDSRSTVPESAKDK